MTQAASLRALAAAVALAGVLTGCSPAAEPAPAAPSVADATSAPGPSADPQLDPASAANSKSYFDAVVSRLLAERSDATGRDVVDALTAAGFDKAAMQVTYDETPTGLAADNVQFSVLLADGCLVGQKGAGGFTSVVAPPLGTGGCLVGQTRPIDW